ncbi:hypothetical protein NLG97_g639 [Lecanicillium saksenae]|uniref:Uncharacterized protein n=1 Tax=Lecanicillium saksenae TaxID=468837 RepID=A0ACC1R7B2_9HYPO|nr:hypothetical protein NLG97_g639 [Lecanicillium saksenae]
MSQSSYSNPNTPSTAYGHAVLGIDFGIDGTTRYHAAARAALLHGDYQNAILYSNECQSCAESAGALSRGSGQNHARLKEMRADCMDISRRATDAMARERSEGDHYNWGNATAECNRERLTYEQDQERRRSSKGVLQGIWSWLTGKGK